MNRSANLYISSSRFAARVVGSMLGCFGLQALAFFGLHSKAAKTESNYFSTMSRFQEAVAPGAEIALTGSSISGRLPGRESGNSKVANLGSDGGSSLDGLTMLDERLVARPKWLALEINTVFSNVGFPETPAVAGARGPWFKIGGRVPLLGASARPSGMLYGCLLRRKREELPTPFSLESVPSAIPSPTLDLLDLSDSKRERLMRVGRSLLKAKEAGTSVLLVRYPAGQVDQARLDEMNFVAWWLHQQTGSPYLDLDSQIPDSSLAFTDSVHLEPSSAARALVTIRDVIKKLEQGEH